jgi:hypothetical protein
VRLHLRRAAARLRAIADAAGEVGPTVDGQQCRVR